MSPNQHLVAEAVWGSTNTVRGVTTWRVVDGDVLEVSHRAAVTGDVTTSHYRLVPVERQFVELPAVTA